MKHLLFVFLVFSVFSCIPHKKLLYLRPDGSNPVVQKFETDTSFQYRVQPGDLIKIEISSTVASQIEVFNKKYENAKEESNNDELNGYLVGPNGNIEMPLIGPIYVDSLTIPEINKKVKEKLSEYIDFAYVSTRLASTPITVLGEVRNPGRKIFYNEKVSIFEAIGIAGDIIETGNKKSVKIIRKRWDKTEIITLDVSDTKIVSSDYFYLMANDILYIEPLKVKSVRINSPTVTLLLSGLTLIFLVIRYTR